jgi:tRNA pseudouridine38-40 synthase
MNKAISTLLNSEISIMGAGRTDTGVHAMYAHFDFETPFDIPSLVHKLNSFLPKDIVIYDIIAVKEAAHARFDFKRTYEYHINTFKDPFLQEQSWYFHQN